MGQTQSVWKLKNIIIFNTEDESSILMDFIINDYLQIVSTERLRESAEGLKYMVKEYY